MPHIISPDRWRQIPDYPCEIDARHPSAQGCVRLYNFRHRGRDAVDNGPAWSLGSSAERTTGHGVGVHRGVRVNATATATSNESLGPQISAGITVLMLAAKHAQIVNSDWLFGAHAASVGLYDWGFIESASGGPLAFYAVNTGGTIGATPSSTLWAANAGVQAWVGTYGSGDGNVRQYCNGVQTGSTGLTGNIRNSSLQVRTCYWNNGVPDFSLFLAGVWNRAMGPGEVQEISRNYGALLRRERRVFYSLASGLTLPVTEGTLTLAGQSVGFATAMPVSHGTVTLTGQSVAFATALPVSHASLSLTGQSVALQLGGNLALPVDHGALALAGQPIGLRTTMPVTAGALTLTGQSVTLQAGGALTLPVDHGSLTLTGQPVGLVLPASPSRARCSFSRREARAVFSRRRADCAFSRRTAAVALG